MKKYQQFKSSELDWIGDIPNNWQLVPLKKYLISIVDYRGKTPTKKEDGEIFLVTARNIKGGIINYSLSQEFISKDDYEQVMQRGKPIIGDVLFTTEAPLGEVANVDRDDIALAQRIIKFRANPRFLDNYYLKLWLSSYVFQSDLLRYATGSTALGIKASKLNFLRLLLPPIEEQRIILNYLDAKIKKINLLISNKQHLIDLLTEERTTIINQAVTKGIDADVKLKDSGLEWLGAVPNQWIKIAVKRILKSSDYGLSESSLLEGEFKYIGMGHIQAGKVILENVGYLNNVPEELILENNDLLYNRTNSEQLVCKVGLFNGNKCDKVTFASYLVRFKIKEDYNPEYINFLLNSTNFLLFARAQALKSINQSNLNPTKYLNLIVFVPKKDEQNKIVKFIKSKVSEIDVSVTQIKKEIDLLQEYRTALISEVVTGKIDVREEVAAWT